MCEIVSDTHDSPQSPYKSNIAEEAGFLLPTIQHNKICFFPATLRERFPKSQLIYHFPRSICNLNTLPQYLPSHNLSEEFYRDMCYLPRMPQSKVENLQGKTGKPYVDYTHIPKTTLNGVKCTTRGARIHSCSAQALSSKGDSNTDF